MIGLIKKILNKEKNSSPFFLKFKTLKEKTKIDKIFKSITDSSENNEVRYVGGCIRKILSKEEVDDIDLATNIEPSKVLEILKNNNIAFYESGIEHGTVTVKIDNFTFEITSLRKDISTDGRHAKVQFSDNWYEDASRRDFTFNSIYADLNGNLYDPFNGKKDLENGEVKFIGDAETRIKEDYLRILRYFRFYTQYSQHKHDIVIIQSIKKNLDGIKKISKERILDELFKILNLNNFYELFNNDFSCSIILTIFPQLKHYDRFRVIKNIPNKIINKLNIPLILSILLIDNSEDCEFFLYKFKFSNRDKNRILFLLNKYKKINIQELLDEQKLVKLAYLDNTAEIIDLLVFSTFVSEKIDINTVEKRISFLDKLSLPIFPIKADYLKLKFNFSESKELGLALKKLEQSWIDNDFIIDKSEIKNILKLS